jgi:hypothetical protein
MGQEGTADSIARAAERHYPVWAISSRTESELTSRPEALHYASPSSSAAACALARDAP